MSARNKVTNAQKGKRGEITNFTTNGAASMVKTNHRGSHAELERVATMIKNFYKREKEVNFNIFICLMV